MAENLGRSFEGNLVGAGLKFAIVVSRFNEFITQKLLDGALDAFRRHDVDMAGVDVAYTPGTFEMPLVAKRLAQSGKYDAVCCLGAVMRGGTPHFDYVATQVTRGIAEAAWESGLPVAFGVLTTDTLEQAVERAGTKGGNKGFDAAVTAIEMAQLMRTLKAAGR
ncbi:MAG: 6,7-dimethyl-8-ribityllumazine synthase [Deltaproteobacteria bacterium]|nr:6,7-dimethyl-8-ribityllumazine synthase [Deltaproteobacteria bacterium]